MAHHHQGTETSAQTNARHIHHGLQNLLQNPDTRASLHQAQQRACSCTLCWSHDIRLQQGSGSPSCFKTPISEINRDHPCMQHQGLGFSPDAGTHFNEEFRYGFRPSHWPAQKPSHVPAAESFPMQRHHSDPLHVPQTRQSDGMSMGAVSALRTTPAATWFSPSSFSQGRDLEQKGPTIEPTLKASGGYGGLSNQVILYSWYLVRHSSSSEDVKVSVGGFFTLRTAGTERFETAAIVQRIEKCRLLAQDGVEVRLVGLIDDCTTVSNGFSLNIVQSFLSGFPYTWNHLLDDEFRASNSRQLNRLISGSCGLSGAVETSQLSFEGGCSDQKKGALSPSLQGVSSDHPEKANDIELNVKQNMTAEAHSEKEADLNIWSALESCEKVDTSNSKDDQITNSNSTGVFEQQINDVRNTTEEGLQENAHVDQVTCSAREKLDRASKTQPQVQIEEDGTVHTPIGAGNALLNQSNCSTESLRELAEKGDKCDQKSRISPRITRSMHKISKHVANSQKKSRNISDGANTSVHCDGEEIHTPVEQCRPCMKPKFHTSPSTLFQKNGGDVCYRRSRKRLSTNNNRDNIDGGKSSNISPCYYTEGVESPAAMEAQRLERSMNVEASPNSEGEGHTINQEEACIAEVLQVNGNSTEDEEGNLLAFVQKSFKSEDKLTKKKEDNDFNKRESHLSSRSSGQGSKRLMIPPPLPRPRVPVSKRLISAAFGLKTSRSGRLLVPPLAHWRSQSLLRDKDGGIIAISDGSKDMSNDDMGYFKFKPPAEAGLKELQKRLRQVATDCTPSKKKRTGIKKRQ